MWIKMGIEIYPQTIRGKIIFPWLDIEGNSGVKLWVTLGNPNSPFYNQRYPCLYLGVNCVTEFQKYVFPGLRPSLLPQPRVSG